LNIYSPLLWPRSPKNQEYYKQFLEKVIKLTTKTISLKNFKMPSDEEIYIRMVDVFGPNNVDNLSIEERRLIFINAMSVSPEDEPNIKYAYDMNELASILKK
jgi:hypothetical protein